ncbi:NAD(P)-dependent oxidoreductase [Phanerochaete sordida]|uniref:NAD(P)-dependent oxidoreductase n=1 Tax=Phanerochaete sordida TaxID=48140 RepID=A0A9P3GK62_9APHY|nr:NAD(P)-dependent oxidoreductase [Phanerochaete sordida]
MKIAVTGCSGSVGQRVCTLALARGHTVRGIDSARPRADAPFAAHAHFAYAEHDLRAYPAVLAALRGCDAVVQLAAVPTPTDYLVETHNTNVVISWNVLRAAAELGITRVAQASSVNVVQLVWTPHPRLHYLPIDEDHPREPDEPYGLSKLICETQADAIVRRFPQMRVASLRPSWSIPNRDFAKHQDAERRKNDLWGWVHRDSCADAFLLAITADEGAWTGHEAFFIVAPDTTEGIAPEVLYEQFWSHVPIKAGKDLKGGFFDSSKAERILGWVHTVPDEDVHAG